MRISNRTVRRVIGVTTVAALPLVAALTAEAHSLPSAAVAQPVAVAAAQPSGGTTVLRATPSQRARAATAWTLEARRAAKPLAFPGDAVASPQTAAQPSGRAGSVPGRTPAAESDRLAKAQFPQEWAAASSRPSAAADADADFGTAGVFTSYLANFYSTMWRDYPYRATGKLYITGGGYCSASVISPNNIIVTAAHCVYDTVNNRFLNGWTFVPADRAGAAPYGSFPWTSARVLNNWINASGTDRRYDVAVITLGNNSAGQPVTFYSGWLGRSWDQSSTQHHHAIGYPSNLNSGLYTYVCAAESFSGGADVLGMGCNMTFGSSGGPWIRAFAPHVSGAVNQANSVVSGGTPGTNTFYGARFSSNNIVPLCNAQGC